MDENAIEQIHERITREGGLFRRINDTIFANSEGKLKFEITSPNLQVTDPSEAKKILDIYGHELLSTGYENFVLEKYALLADSEKKRPKFLLLKSRAEGKSGKYRAALDTLGTIESMNCELSPTEKFHFESIENHSNWLLGQINTEQFLAKLQELSTNALAKDSILNKFYFLHFSLMYGRGDEVNTSELFGEIVQLKKIAQEILADDNFSQEMKVNIEFSILENELSWLILEQTLLTGESLIYEATSTYIPEHWDRKENFPIELKKWVDKSNELIDRAQNIITKADISYLQIRLWFHQNQSNQFWETNTGKEYFVNKEASELFVKMLQFVIDNYIGYQQFYSVIRAKMLMVEILSLIGRPEESETLRKQINSQANRMSYDALKKLTEFSLHKTLFDYALNTSLEKDN